MATKTYLYNVKENASAIFFYRDVAGQQVFSPSMEII